MSYSKVMTDGTVCRTGPNCRRHGGSGSKAPVQQITDLQQKIDSVFHQPATPVETSPSGKLIDRAASCSLSWDGEKPVWWEDYSNALAQDEELPTTAELIDVIDSPAGPLAVIWQHEAQEDNTRGVSLSSGYGAKVCYFKSMEAGETLGFVNMAYIDDSTFERTFGKDELTPFRYQDRHSGVRYGLRDRGGSETYGYRDLEGEELLAKKREIWAAAHNDFKMSTTDSEGEYVPSYSVKAEHAPDDKTVAKDLKKFSRSISKEMKASKERFAIPYVDYSNVEAPLRGKGYGSAMYIYTARMLAKEGKVLRGSGIQSEDATGLWGRFAKKFPNNVGSVVLSSKFGNSEPSPTLDFTK